MSQTFSKLDLEMTQRAIDLAKRGIGQVSPSPPVGCVIVSEEGKIVGEGFYLYENLTHAEVLALKQAGEHAKGGTAYVSLEPHSHFGRTKPCTDALINAGISRVVCPIEDPNPLVSGNGFRILRESGIEVTAGVLKEKAEQLCENFIHWHKQKRPFVHLKMAMSLDGRISLSKDVATPITGSESSKKVQDLRHEYDAILIGGNTAYVDNPNLTDRSGKQRHRKLVRVVLDNRLQICEDSNLVNSTDDSPTIVFTNSNDTEKAKHLEQKGVEIVNQNTRDLKAVLDNLAKRDLQSVLVEGGSEVAGAFVSEKLVDKFSFFIAPMIIGGTSAPIAISGKGFDSIENTLKLEKVTVNQFGSDFAVTGYPKK